MVPVGFKLCIVIHGRFAIAKPRVNKNFPDFIVIDGAEGGTGASCPIILGCQ